MNEKLPILGAVGAATLASVCCIGPVVLAGMSVGAVAMAQRFAPWRPVFLALTFSMLVFGFYFVYRRPKRTAACAEKCDVGGMAKWGRPLIWTVTLLVIALVTFPYYYGPLSAALDNRQPQGGVAVRPATFASVELKIVGMTCTGCAEVIKSKLLQTPGVTEAQVEFPAGRATIRFDPSQTSPAKLVEVVNSTGYKAALLRSAGS